MIELLFGPDGTGAARIRYSGIEMSVMIRTGVIVGSSGWPQIRQFAAVGRVLVRDIGLTAFGTIEYRLPLEAVESLRRAIVDSGSEAQP